MKGGKDAATVWYTSFTKRKYGTARDQKGVNQDQGCFKQMSWLHFLNCIVAWLRTAAQLGWFGGVANFIENLWGPWMCVISIHVMLRWHAWTLVMQGRCATNQTLSGHNV